MLTIHHPLELTELREQVLQDSRLAHIISAIQQGTSSFHGLPSSMIVFCSRGGWCYQKTPFISTLLREFHDSPIGSHSSAYEPIST